MRMHIACLLYAPHLCFSC